MTKEQKAIEILTKKVDSWKCKRPRNPIILKRLIDEIDTENNAIETVLNMLKEKDKQIEEVLNLIFEFGQIDGDHHKAWVIDQIVKILTKDKYDEWVRNYVYDEETGDTYSWYKGIAP